MKMASNQKMQENELALKVNFTQECRWPVLIFSNFFPLYQIHGALVGNQQIQPGVGKKITCTQEENIFGSFQILNW